MKSPAIETIGISKSFGSLQANQEISLQIQAGEIFGIVGENGAGKSTLLKILYGALRPDTGEIRIHGKSVKFSSPREAIQAGIGMVHQHFMLAGPESVFENVILGLEGSGALLPIPRHKTQEKLNELSLKTGFTIPWEKSVESLPVGIQQRVEILKLLYRNANILILDEPTAVLTPLEVHELFTKIRSLRSEGKTIILVTHKLKEILELTDRFLVLRQGKVVGQGVSAQSTDQEIASLMVGREVNLRSQEKPPPSHKELKTYPVHGMKSGEILGIAGVEGNGQSELLASIGRPPSSALLPEDRIREGLLLQSSLEENLLLSSNWRKKCSKYGWILKGKLRENGALALKRFDVRPPDLTRKACELSGGNQQKFVFAREFEDEPDFIIAAHPTRGVDVGAIEFLHAELLRARARGAAILLVSSELEEITALSDRVIVLFQGKPIAEFPSSPFSIEKMGAAMGGVSPS